MNVTNLNIDSDSTTVSIMYDLLFIALIMKLIEVATKNTDNTEYILNVDPLQHHYC